MIKVGIVGVGGIAGAHLNGYASLTEQARIVALCDKDPERASGKGRTIAINVSEGGSVTSAVRLYLDYREFVTDPEVEVVDVCLPTDLHAEVTVAALEAGKHVLCEKPMALNVEQCDRMIAAAKANNRFLMVAHCIRFWPEYLALKEIVDSGRYGKVLSANFRRLSSLPRWTTDNWMAQPARSGGAILDLHIHDADYLNYLFGIPREVHARGVVEEHGVSYVGVELRYADEKFVFVDSAWFRPSTTKFQATFLVYLERALVQYDPNIAPLTVYPDEGEPFAPELPSCNPYGAEIAYFLDCVAQGTAPTVVTPWDARESIRLIEAEYRSLSEKRDVAL